MHVDPMLVGLVAGAPGHLPDIGAAVLVALVAAGCYAASAVLQHRLASRQQATGGAALVMNLARRPAWWVAIGLTLAGALLHVAALGLGPLSMVQPLGVTSLVLALPLGAALASRVVTRGEWAAALAVAGGLAAVLAVAPHHATSHRLPVTGILAVVAGVGVVVVGLLVLARQRRGPAVAVLQATAAATCFGTASAMARIAVTSAGPILLVALLALVCAAVGFSVSQLAYRDGGLGAPLAIVTLVDPLVAVSIGIALLGEPLVLSPGKAALGLAGLAATVAGIRRLARDRTPPPPPDDAGARSGPALHDVGAGGVAGVVR